MDHEMRVESVRRPVFPAVVFVAAFLLLPCPTLAQNWPGETEALADDLRTSVKGPLQERLAQAYPNSFQQGVDIFWEPRDGWVSDDVFNWWFSIVPEEDRGGINREGAERMFSRFPNQGRVFSLSKKRRLCAVVGPSRNLLESRYGHLIDAHDVVIRINRAPTDDYDSDVGDRTTHHLMWPRKLEEGQFDRRAFLLMTPVAFNTQDIFGRIIELVLGFEWDPELVRFIHPAFVKYLHENWTEERGYYPSTGFIALMLALHVCDEVDVFGFGADALGRWDRYYSDGAVDESAFHPGDYEGQLRREMEARGLLKVFRGSRAERGVRDAAPGQDSDALAVRTQ
jgi:hypothetical protein